ncbi:hypothetical protein Mapa_003228 [Marchantia paleacea]|nr:hypothetical protein Mapa_003228 [Marchantia paleacea]
MHEWGDSGITAVFLALIVAAVISVGVAQQVRARAARIQEIRRLQSEAAHQAQREEAQAAAEYTSMVATRNFCANCKTPSSTSRCSRCKTARYCGSVCQKQHWNDGHKEECRAPDPPSSGSSVASSRNFSDVFSRSSSTSESRTLSEVSDFQGSEDTNHYELSRPVLSVTANGALSKPKKVLFPYSLFEKFFSNDRLKVPPCGLINCGNSCFANAVLQCLTYTRPLTAYLLEGHHSEECRRRDWCFMCELQDHVWRVRQEQNAFSPIRILSRIRNIGGHLGYGRQEDAHEFMRFAIDSMQSICLDEAGGEKFVDPRSQETTLIHHIFGGHLQSQVQCMRCQHESNRYEKMMDLAVEIHGSVETLEDALKQFTASEWLDGDNKYKCDRCNAYVKARKRLTLHEAPNILTIALKRFQTGKFGKLNKRVTFPEVLDMLPYMSEKGDKPPSYLLYAVVVHVDMLNASFFGHYICYVKDSQGIWYKIDDSKVKEVDIEKVMSQRAYMLFYKRSSVRSAPEMDEEVAAVNTPAVGRSIYKDLGVEKVYPGASHLVPGVMTAVGGTMGLHAMVEPRQREGYVEGVPQTVKAHAFVNGEHATTQPSSWERDLVCVSNDDEISVEQSGCIASSSSHSVISPTSSSHLSMEEPGVLRKVLFCNPPASSTEEGTQFASNDLLSPMSSDLADITLNMSPADKPSTPKIGKRRLEEGLTPLPTPKPLDTDQLPTWPANSNGRSSPSTPVSLSAANQMNGVVPSAIYPSRQSYSGDKSGESPAPPGSPVQHRLSSDQTCLAASAELGCDPERIHLDMMSYSLSAGASDEDLVGRAKRQHVEVDSSEFSLMERVTKPSGMGQALEQPDIPDLDRRDNMEWNDLVPQPGSPASVAASGSVFDSCDDYVPADTNHCAPASEVQAFPSSLRQVLLHQQVKDRSTLPFHTDETLSNMGTHPPSPERAVGGSAGSLKADSWRTMQPLPAAGMVVFRATAARSASLDALGASKTLQSQVTPGLGALARSEDEDTTFEDLDTMSILPLLEDLEQPEELQQSADLAPQDQTCKVIQLPIGTPHIQSAMDNGASTSYSKEDGLLRHSPESACVLESKQDLEAATDFAAAPAKPQKQKSTFLPLFAPGFLNRVNTPPADSKSRHGSNGATGKLNGEASNGGALGNPHGEENGASGRYNGVENAHTHSNDSRDGPSSKVLTKTDRRASASGVSNGVGHGFLLTAANSRATSSTSHSHGASGEAAHPMHENAGLQNGAKSDDHSQGHHGEAKLRNKAGSSSKGKRSAAGHVGNGAVVSSVPEEQAAAQAVQVSRSRSVGRAASGKLKQGRNESCHCGSQRKWKKCCGKSEGMTPEITRRRLVI